jgi:hypothetical protein
MIALIVRSSWKGVALTSIDNDEVTDWLSPLNRINWIRAFKTRATTCTLRDGRKFNIKYSSDNQSGVKPLFYKTTEETRELAHVSPADTEQNGNMKLIPRGYFDMSKVTDKAWIYEGRKATRVSEYGGQ